LPNGLFLEKGDIVGDSTKIEWTDATWNPVTGCAKVSQGCKHCYAERDWARLVHLPAYHGRAFADVACHPKRLDQPLIWRRPRRIFVNSMSDLFHPAVPFEFIEQVHEVIRESERHTFQILTKRPGRMLEFWKWRKEVYLANAYTSTPPRNAWYGVSVEDQATADERIPLLLQTPAAVRWISAEPLLGPVSVGQYLSRTNMPGLSMLPGFADPLPGIDWVVAGGESGPKARPTHPDWLRSLRDQCKAAGVPFLFKQWGEWISADQDECPVRGPARRWMWADGAPWHWQDGQRAMPLFCRVGKTAAGRLLDGVLHDDYPEVAET